MLLGLGAVAVGYLIWKNQSTTSFSGGVQSPRMNASGSKLAPYGIGNPCGCTGPCNKTLGVCTKISGNYAELYDCTQDRNGNYPCTLLRSGTINIDSTANKF